MFLCLKNSYYVIMSLKKLLCYYVLNSYYVYYLGS